MQLPPPFVPESSIFKGVGIGTAVVLGEIYVSEALTVQRYSIHSAEAVEEEVERFIDAHKKLEGHFRDAKSFLPPDTAQENKEIFEIYLRLLKEPFLLKYTVDLIRQKKINAEAATVESLTYIQHLLNEKMAPKAFYLKDRIDDIELLMDSFVAVLHGKERFPTANFHPNSVVVTRNLSPAELVALPRKQVVGIITESGSPTSHTALLAQALELPAVMGVPGILDKIQARGPIILDAALGHVILNPDKDTLGFYKTRQASLAVFQREIVRMAHIPARTLDDRQVEICANLQLIEELPAIMSYGAEGIGLYRTEMMYLARGTLPTEEELFESYRKVVGATNPRVVTIRTLDLGADKMPVSLGPARSDQNQALGLRAIRFCLKHPDIFRVQLRAILRASIMGNVRIMLPMVSNLDEIDEVKELVKDVKKELLSEGKKVAPKIPLGIMVEVPAAVMMVKEFGKKTDFFSIGTNDLIQYCLALDRTNPEVTDLYQPFHPSILRMIKIVIDAGKALNIPVSICGGMAADPVSAALLVGMGADMLSMPFFDIPRIKRLVRMSFIKDMKKVAAEALATSSFREADNIISGYLKRKFPDLYS
ncbi:MAG: phosphoenolpyruvate--protein phosphotransferase [Deltaproteobacteria bacterium]|nr:phosphoenolpyruvate--protein phosphotransferase [Deltaproteobacteria bacterium]